MPPAPFSKLNFSRSLEIVEDRNVDVSDLNMDFVLQQLAGTARPALQNLRCSAKLHNQDAVNKNQSFLWDVHGWLSIIIVNAHFETVETWVLGRRPLLIIRIIVVTHVTLESWFVSYLQNPWEIEPVCCIIMESNQVHFLHNILHLVGNWQPPKLNQLPMSLDWWQCQLNAIINAANVLLDIHPLAFSHQGPVTSLLSEHRSFPPAAGESDPKTKTEWHQGTEGVDGQAQDQRTWHPIPWKNLGNWALGHSKSRVMAPLTHQKLI